MLAKRKCEVIGHGLCRAEDEEDRPRLKYQVKLTRYAFSAQSGMRGIIKFLDALGERVNVVRGQNTCITEFPHF